MPRRPGVHPGRDMKRNWQTAILNRCPHRVIDRQVIVRMLRVMRAPDWLAGQIDAAKAHLGRSLDFGSRHLDVCGHNRGDRRHEIVVLAESLPCPIIPDPALRVAEFDVVRRPHRQALVRKNNLGVDAIPPMVPDPFLRRTSRLPAQAVLAAFRRVRDIARAQPRFLVALRDDPFLALFIDLDMRQAMLKFFVDPLLP
jgi:hypothetical protein